VNYKNMRIDFRNTEVQRVIQKFTLNHFARHLPDMPPFPKLQKETFMTEIYFLEKVFYNEVMC